MIPTRDRGLLKFVECCLYFLHLRKIATGDVMQEKQIQVERFTFEVTFDPTVDALFSIEIMVFFMGEPCCDENGHQYRLYLPAGLKESSLRDLCEAFTKAVHCEQFALVA